MNRKKVLVNIFSNWTNFVAGILIAFFVSPIIVHNLGNEYYGIWTLIISITGYFTVLDFGVNTAVVRYISMYTAKKEFGKANEIYTTSIIFFIVIGIIVLVASATFGLFFKNFFNIETLGRKYLYLVCLIAGTDLAFGFVFSVYQAALCGLQDFFKINVISIMTILIKNILIVIFLLNGYSLLSLAIIQLTGNLLKTTFQYLVIRKDYGYLKYQSNRYDKTVLKQIFNYSIYSFMISIALKILFFTDSVVIGKVIKVSEIAFFAIPAMILQYSEKIIYAIVAVMVPVISSYDAVGDREKNKEIYSYGSKYSLALSVPIVFVLYTKGADFISLWMGEEYGRRAIWVLKILVIGYAFSLPQMISQGILKGISRHKAYAYILIVEAFANFVISILLARPYGIEGVALGTTIPLIIVNIIVVPLYTCYVLKINMFDYLLKAYVTPLLALAALFTFHYYFEINVSSYAEFALYTVGVVLIMAFFSLFLIVDKSHRAWAFNGIKDRLLR
jgi:O-antigen/teichoic acid export membrane protein